MERLKPRNKHILTILLLAGLVFSVIQMTRSAAPTPGHLWSEIGDNPSDVLIVSRGGTGTSTLAANSIILGNGTGAVKLVAPGTSGNLLTSNGTSWVSTTSPSALTGAVILLYSNQTDSTDLNTSTTQTALRNWNTGIVNTTYSYYMIEATVVTNIWNNSNRNCLFNINFREGAGNVIKSFQWRTLSWTLAGVRNNGTNFTGTLKAMVASTAVPNNANFYINGQMSISHANYRIMVRSFKVYGIK
jgi:hypothetical protein